MSFNANCGERLREERDRLEFTQQEMADRMGVRREMSSKYERGQAVPGGDALSAFAAVGGDIQYVLTGVRSSNALTPDEAELLAGYRGLDIRAKANMLGMLDVVGTPLKTSRSTVNRHHIGSVEFHGDVGNIKNGDHTTGDMSVSIGTKKKKKDI